MKNKLKKLSVLFLSIVLVLSISFSMFSCSPKHKTNIEQMTAKWDNTIKKKAESTVKTEITAKMNNNLLKIKLSMKTLREFDSNKIVTINTKILVEDVVAEGLFVNIINTSQSQGEKEEIVLINPGDPEEEDFKEGLSLFLGNSLLIKNLKGSEADITVTINKKEEYATIKVNKLNFHGIENDIYIKPGRGQQKMPLKTFLQKDTYSKLIFNEKKMQENETRYERLKSYGLINLKDEDYKYITGYKISELDNDVDKKQGAKERLYNNNKSVEFISTNSKIYVKDILDNKVAPILENSNLKQLLDKTLGKIPGLSVDSILKLMRDENEKVEGLSYKWSPTIKFNFDLDREVPRKYTEKTTPKINKLYVVQNDTKVIIDSKRILSFIEDSIKKQEISESFKKQLADIKNSVEDMIITINTITEENYTYID